MEGFRFILPDDAERLRSLLHSGHGLRCQLFAAALFKKLQMEEEDRLDQGSDLFELFFNSNYVEQTVTLRSGRVVPFLALKTAFTDCDLTGQILWPGCSLLMSWLDRHIDIFKSKTVIEVGAGTGICAVFVARYGDPTLSVATDGSEPIIDLMEKNAALHKTGEKVRCEHMRWIPEDYERVVAEHGKFDFVIGSEIAYNENCIEGLVDSVDALLKEDGRFVIGHIDRYAKVTRALMAKMERSGFEKESETDWDELMDAKMELIVGSVIVWKRK